MRSIASAKILSEQIGSSLEIAWLSSKHLKSEFTDLFKPIENVKVRSYGTKDTIQERIKLIQFRKSRFKLIEFLSKRKYDLILNRKVMKYNAIKEDSLDKLRGTRVLIRSHTTFYKPHALSFTFFQPIDLLQEIIELKAKEFDEYTAGVHIRRNDNKKSILLSPDELFFKEIDSRIEKQPKFNFFLASDCSATKSLFIDRYGPRTHFFNKENCSTSLQSDQCAVIDLYLLSRTKEIIGSHWSTFSETAANIRDIPIFVVR